MTESLRRTYFGKYFALGARRYRGFKKIAYLSHSAPNFLLWRNCSNLAYAAYLLRFIGHKQLDTHTHTHTHIDTQTVRLLWTSVQPVAKVATFTKCNKDKKRMSMPLAGFELVIPVIERPLTYTCSANEAGPVFVSMVTQNKWGELSRLRNQKMQVNN
jgi:hypothetical protein